MSYSSKKRPRKHGTKKRPPGMRQCCFTTCETSVTVVTDLSKARRDPAFTRQEEAYTRALQQLQKHRLHQKQRQLQSPGAAGLNLSSKSLRGSQSTPGLLAQDPSKSPYGGKQERHPAFLAPMSGNSAAAKEARRIRKQVRKGGGGVPSSRPTGVNPASARRGKFFGTFKKKGSDESAATRLTKLTEIKKDTLEAQLSARSRDEDRRDPVYAWDTDVTSTIYSTRRGSRRISVPNAITESESSFATFENTDKGTSEKQEGKDEESFTPNSCPVSEKCSSVELPENNECVIFGDLQQPIEQLQSRIVAIREEFKSVKERAARGQHSPGPETQNADEEIVAELVRLKHELAFERKKCQQVILAGKARKQREEMLAQEAAKEAEAAVQKRNETDSSGKVQELEVRHKAIRDASGNLMKKTIEEKAAEYAAAARKKWEHMRNKKV